MKSKTFTRTELYNLIWSKPLTTLAKEYSYSDNGLRKLCVRNKIPLPKAGYWSKIKFGKKVQKTRLPKGDDIRIEIYLRTKGEEPAFHSNSIRGKVKREIESSVELNFIVPDKLLKPNILIREAKRDLRSRKPSNWGNTSGLVETSKGFLNIAVSKSNIPRALRFMDTLIKLLKKRGHAIKVSETTEIVVNDELIKIRFREVLKRSIIKDSSWERTELIPSGILSFRVDTGYPEKQWRDSDTIPLESKLLDILTYLEVKATQLKEERMQWEIYKKKIEEKLKKENDLKLLKENEMAKSNQLFETFSRWQKSQDLRSYLKAFEAHASKTNSMTQEKENWIAWANNKADWIDPIIAKEDVILGLYKE